MIDELKQWEYDKGYTKGQIDIIEKIKADINGINDTMGVRYYQYIPKAEVLRIIDNHIAELKGE